MSRRDNTCHKAEHQSYNLFINNMAKKDPTDLSVEEKLNVLCEESETRSFNVGN